MKRIIYFLLLAFFPLFAQTQQDSVKQITNFDFDISEPTFVTLSSYDIITSNIQSYIFFVSHNGDSSNIAGIKYSADNNTFGSLFNLTNDNFINKNPQAIITNNEQLVVIWETNRNGNFDIAYRIKNSDGIWDSVKIATNTPEDEENVKLVNSQYDSQEVNVVFKRGNLTLIKNILNPEQPEDTLFIDNNNITYSQAAATYGFYYGLNVIASAIRDSAGIKNLVIRKKEHDTWNTPQIITTQGVPSQPSFNFEYDVIFDETLNGKTSVNYFAFPFDSQPETAFSDSVASYFNYHSQFIEILTKNTPLGYFPYILEKRDPAGDYVKFFSDNGRDTTIKVSSNIPHPAVGVVDVIANYYVIYYAWIDSANGAMNLFGKRILINFGSVNDEVNITKNFKLFQNYPNPFSKSSGGNPTTTINFSISANPKSLNETSRQNVRLDVYDILGRRITTLVNETKTPGDYSVKFDASKFSAGIYFYSLRVGNFVTTKKMILLK